MLAHKILILADQWASSQVNMPQLAVIEADVVKLSQFYLYDPITIFPQWHGNIYSYKPSVLGISSDEENSISR